MASIIARLAHRWPWLVATVAAVVVAIVAVVAVLPQGGALAFRITGPIEVRWDDFSRTGGNITVTLCNTSTTEVTQLEADVHGIEFTRPGATAPSPGVIVTHPPRLAAGSCTEIGLKKAPELQPNAYRGTLVVSGAGGGTIRRDFVLSGPPTQ